jgi:ABC-type transporter Mla subunit MlaD
MSLNVQRTDLFVGMFLVAMAALVLAALVATSGWGTDRYAIFVRTGSAQDITVDTKIFLQGLEVGRVTAINPRPTGRAGQLEFILRLSLLDRFPDGTPLRLPRGTVAEVVQAGLVGGSQVQLKVLSDSAGTLAPSDTIGLTRGTGALDAFGNLARDLKGTIEAALVSTTNTMNAFRVLSESLTVATGAARRFVVGVQPGTEKVLAGVAVNLESVRTLLDSTTRRSGVTVRQVDSTLAASRVLMQRLDSLTRVLIAMGGENRPEIAAMIVNFRQMSEQLQYILDQVGRRPMRLLTGIRMPDSLRASRPDSTWRAPHDSAPGPAPPPRP